jgi:glycine cleavage system H protein
MSDIPADLRYSAEHEYVKSTDDPDVYLVGITDYAQGELGDIVFVELPSVGDSFDQNATFGTIEAVKAVSDLYSPVAGEVVEINEALDDDPSVVNDDPYGDGWMIKIRVADAGQVEALMDATAYSAHVGE